MPEYSWSEFEKAAAGKTAHLPECRVWLLSGEEAWLREQFQARLRAQLLSEEERSWGEEVFRLSPALVRSQPPEGTWARSILRSAATLPFFATRRVVMVDEVQLLPEEQQEGLAAALATLPPTTVLILSTPEAGAQKRSAPKRTAQKKPRLSAELCKAARSAGNLIRFEPLSLDAATAWAEQQAQKAGKRMERSAATLLVRNRLGADLGSLKKEIEKLVLFAGDAPSIRTTHVEEMTPRMLEDKVFDLTDALGAGKAGQARAITLLRGLYHGKEDALRLLSAIVSHFRVLWQTKWLLERGWRPGRPVKEFEEAGQVLIGGRDSAVGSFARTAWKVPKLAQQAGRYTWPQLEQALLALAECDLALKGLSSPPRTDPLLALELALVAISG